MEDSVAIADRMKYLADDARVLREGSAVVLAAARAAAALENVGHLWADRLERGWRPPADAGSFPWEMTRFSLRGLIPGLKSAAEWRGGGRTAAAQSAPKVCALILAGNTPLMSWSPISACLLAGHSVFVKMSRDETMWPRLFRDALAEVDPGIASRIDLDVWPGEDAKTEELVSTADVVIAFGGDATLQTLRSLTPTKTPFFGYGHSVSAGIWTSTADMALFEAWLERLQAQAAAIAQDTLMYRQGGCLSMQALFVDINDPNPHLLPLLKSLLADAFSDAAAALRIPPITDEGIANVVRQARDLAGFEGDSVIEGEDLLWTMIVRSEAKPLTACRGQGVLTVIPFQNWDELPNLFGVYRGRVSSLGVAGTLTPEQRAMLEVEGISRICAAGQMQAPPLDWPNGGFDLLSALASL